MRTLLIDADVVCYQVAMSAEVPIKWDDNLWTLHANEGETVGRFRSAIASLVETLKADAAILCLTDGANWRNGVYPQYKSNRVEKRKPMLLPLLRQLALDEFRTFLRPTLEGDDCLGILGTHPKLVPGEKIICTIDKDLRTIPGQHFNFGKPEEGVFTVTEEEADRFHLVQTIAGDSTDGYHGCPGMGMTTAAKALDEQLAVRPYAHEFKSGARKGMVETRWETTQAESPWHTVVSHYEKAGLTEADALVQARVARILRHTDFNFDTKEPILWTPQTTATS
jgi:DNA polymerase-1